MSPGFLREVPSAASFCGRYAHNLTSEICLCVRLVYGCRLMLCSRKRDPVVLSNDEMASARSDSARRSALRAAIIVLCRVEHLRDIVFKWVPNERGLLLATRNGKPWDANVVVKRHLRPLLVALGIESGGLHAFGHANGSIMDRWNVPLKVRQQRLGHSDPRLTLGTYAHRGRG
jgi:hypothetical protein